MMADYCSIKKDLNNIGYISQLSKKKITLVLMFMKALFLLLVYQMIWWKYLLVLVYSIVLFFKDLGLLFQK